MTGGDGPHPWRQIRTPVQGGYSWCHSILSPPRRASLLVPLPLDLSASLPPEFCPLHFVCFLCGANWKSLLIIYLFTWQFFSIVSFILINTGRRISRDYGNIISCLTLLSPPLPPPLTQPPPPPCLMRTHSPNLQLLLVSISFCLLSPLFILPDVNLCLARFCYSHTVERPLTATALQRPLFLSRQTSLH